MRLHVGCGDLYLPDALNIDKFDLRITDVQADAVKLPVKESTCEGVVAYHLFEHLGYTGAAYALAESFRVLKPGAILELETPDPERSFQVFLENTEPLWRAGVLSWIFGTEATGMGHGGLFPKELLEKLVTEAGFREIKFTAPITHKHRWGIRLTARKADAPPALLLSLLRPLLVQDILEEAVPQEPLEIEIRLWEAISSYAEGMLTAREAEEFLLEWMVIAPQVILTWATLCKGDKSLPSPPGPFPRENIERVAQSLLDTGFCEILRDLFAVLCATVNQAPDGHVHLLNAAKGMIRQWLASPPADPERIVLVELERCGALVEPDPKLSYPGDFDVALGNTPVAGRRPCWPRHRLFTRQHLMERAGWFRDLGIRCFSKGQLDEARRLFRLAINSKVEGLYPVWNMARLQAALGQPDTAQVFYKAAFGFPVSDAIRTRLLSEFQQCQSERTEQKGPVAVGEGADRAFGLLEKGGIKEGSPSGRRGAQQRQGHFPPPRTILWEITLMCQCRCTHCAAAGGNPRPNELSTNEALAVCDQIATLGIPAVCLMGGEPLLHPKWERIASRLRESGLDLGLATNGIALDAEVWHTLDTLGFSQVVISLDGATPEIHDTRRRLKGALEKAQSAIKEMASRPLRDRTVVTSVDKGTLGGLPAIRDWLLENAPGTTWMINIASPAPESRMEKKDIFEVGDFLSLVKFIDENRGKYTGQLDITGAHCTGYFSQKYRGINNFVWSGCQAGINTLGMRSDGAVTGCLVMSDRFIEGNIREKGLAEIWNDPGAFSYNRNFSVTMLKGKCASCRWAEICRGGCRETAYSFTGDICEAPFCLHHLEKTGVIR